MRARLRKALVTGLLTAGTLTGVAATTGCAQLLMGGLVAIQGLLPMAKEQEVAIGRQAAQELLSGRKLDLYDNPRVVEYVERIGKKLAAATDRVELPWAFRVVESESRNAMALPGGFIFITTGMLKSLDNEAQLAAILAHEIAHVTERHGVEQIKRAMVAQGLLISVLASSPEVAQAAGRIAADLVLRGYGRDAELEADEAGATLMAKLDYIPGQFVEMLAELRKGGEMPAWFVPLATHPRVEDRMENVSRFIDKQGLEGDILGEARYKAAMAPLLPPG